ncbi:hypothetical protein diail_2823 [Diaporthe ilicicola]|nr:hypothetical protein diail_2823 [Diaporthe ilicicola]
MAAMSSPDPEYQHSGSIEDQGGAWRGLQRLSSFVAHQLITLMANLQIISNKPSQPVNETKKSTSHTQGPPSTNGNIINITILPNELLMRILSYLAPDNVQANLDRASFRTYKQAQKDLRHVCLVSKQMDAVARQYLYRAAIINNVDILIYLARTLDESAALGQHFKHLVFAVPFILKDVHYRKPNVAALESRPRYFRICKQAKDASNAAKFERISVDRQERYGQNDWEAASSTFDNWVWWNECRILCDLHSEVLLRSTSLESLCFGMISSFQASSLVIPMLTQVGRAIGRGQGTRTVPGFTSKLQRLQLLGDNRDDEGPLFASPVSFLLEFSSLQTLECVDDNGMWFDLKPRQKFEIPRPPISSWQCTNIASIDLQRSRCTPPAIFQICATFPNLEHLSVSTKHGADARSYDDHYVGGSGTNIFLSTGLAKLERLRELSLNLHYAEDVRSMLGEHGVLNLGGLNNLAKIRIPLPSLVEAQPGSDPFLTDLELVLPPSVTHLAVWVDMDSWRNWAGPAATTMLAGLPPPNEIQEFHPRQSALDFMGSVCGLLSSHFKGLKEATYCYGDEALDTACRCSALDELCSHCLATEMLDVHGSGESLSQMRILSSIAEARGVCLRAVQEPLED